MAIYIDPPAQRNGYDKLPMIAKVSEPAGSREAFQAFVPGEQDCWPVCVVDNGSFLAAALCETKEEALRFSELRRDDYRAKAFYFISEEHLLSIDPAAHAKLQRFKALPAQA